MGRGDNKARLPSRSPSAPTARGISHPEGASVGAREQRDVAGGHPEVLLHTRGLLARPDTDQRACGVGVSLSEPQGLERGNVYLFLDLFER